MAAWPGLPTRYDATRVWWAFFLYGKTDVRVLDGGLGAWEAAGFPTEHGQAPRAPSTVSGPRGGSSRGFVAAEPGRAGAAVATMEEVRAASQPGGSAQPWDDDRGTGEWTGVVQLGAASRAGRIPGARRARWQDFRVLPQGGQFVSAAAARAAVAALGMDRGRPQIFYCQSGVRTTQLIFVLYLLGWDTAKLRNYDGSWLEWSYYTQNPIVTVTNSALLVCVCVFTQWSM